MELKCKVIAATQPGPRVLITGGVHGDEFEPMAAIRRLACEIPADKLRGSLTLIPVVNEPNGIQPEPSLRIITGVSFAF